MSTNEVGIEFYQTFPEELSLFDDPKFWDRGMYMDERWWDETLGIQQSDHAETTLETTLEKQNCDQPPVNMTIIPDVKIPHSGGIRKTVKSRTKDDIKNSKSRSREYVPISIASGPTLVLGGRGKSDHELRENHYRDWFRVLAMGQTPPKFFPSRSAYDQSFVWRPFVNRLYGIDIPLFVNKNGITDNPAMHSNRRRKKRVHQ